MKVLQVNCVYKNGSTGKIVQDIHIELLKQGMESIICYGRGKNVKEVNVRKVCGELYAKGNNLFSRFTGIKYGGCFFSTRKLIHIIQKEKPDIVHLHCINGYFVNIYHLVEWLKLSRIKTVLTLHAEFMHTANCDHALDCEKWRSGCGNCPRYKRVTKSLFWDATAKSWNYMKNAFEGFEHQNLTIVSVSPWLQKRAECSPILKGNVHHTILNGVDSLIFHRIFDESLRKKYTYNEEKIVFHATACFSDDPEHSKGGWHFIQLAKKMIDENVLFLVAGKTQIREALPQNIILLGEIQNQEELAKYYSIADVTVLVSKRETFSMVVAESLCCGTPVVGYCAGAPELIAISQYSEFVEQGNLELLEESIRKWLKKESINKEKITKIAKEVYSNKTMVQSYQELYRRML